MTVAGLKKCMPITSDGRDVAAAHSITGRLDVVVASTVPGAQISSRLENSACLTVRSSTTASITSCAALRSSRRAVPEIRASAASRSASASLPRCTAFSIERVIAPVTCATFSALRATNSTSYPPLASTSMIPVAIVPEPTTPIVSTGRQPAVWSAGVGALSTMFGESAAS